VADTKSDEADDKVLYVWRDPFDGGVVHLVNANTIALAREADDAPVDFGGLRLLGDLDELGDLLCRFGVTLDEYVVGIEESAGRRPASGDLATRLAALNDVDFEGVESGEFDPDDEDRFLPEDDKILSDWNEDAPDDEYRGYVVISQAMSSDIPSDIFEEFCSKTYGGSPAYDGHIDDRVLDDKLPALIAALEARGYTVIDE